MLSPVTNRKLSFISVFQKKTFPISFRYSFMWNLNSPVIYIDFKIAISEMYRYAVQKKSHKYNFYSVS